MMRLTSLLDVAQLHDEAGDQNRCRHGQDGGAQNGGSDGEPFAQQQILVLNDAHARGDEEQSKVGKKHVDHGEGFLQKTPDGHQGEQKEKHADDGARHRSTRQSGDNDAGKLEQQQQSNRQNHDLV